MGKIFTINDQQAKCDPRVKDVLILLGAGSFFAASQIMPGLPILIKPFLDAGREKERNEWNKYNTWRLRQILKRMRDSKLIEISYGQNDAAKVTITEKGKKKLLEYNLENIRLKHNKWDGKWRIIIYDISSRRDRERKHFRKMLKKLNFLKLQKSIYLTPYPCQDEIESKYSC